MKLKVPVKTLLAFMLFTLSPAYAAIQTIDVLVVYPQVATTVTEGKDMPVTVASRIENANQTYKNSEVNLKLRVVHLEKIAISGTGNVSRTAIKNLAKDQHILKLREKHGADLVVLMTLRRNISSGFVCGIAYVGQGANNKLSSGSKNAGFSVSAVNCDNSTFVHELGHNMGLGHSFTQGSKGGLYEWGRGHGVYNKFSTTMAYPQSYGSAVRIQQFSSPTQNKCMGLPCGVHHNQNDAADSVSSLKAVATQVSKFFPTKTSSPVVGVPKEPVKPTAPGNIITNGNFDELGSWRNFRNLSSLAQSNSKFSSKFGLKISDRQFYYSGPIQTIPIEIGKTYQLSAQAKLATPNEMRKTVGAILLLNTANRGLQFQYIGGASAVRGEWTAFKNIDFTVTSTYGKINSIDLLFYGPDAGIDFFLDEVSIKAK